MAAELEADHPRTNARGGAGISTGDPPSRWSCAPKSSSPDRTQHHRKLNRRPSFSIYGRSPNLHQHRRERGPFHRVRDDAGAERLALFLGLIPNPGRRPARGQPRPGAHVHRPTGDDPGKDARQPFHARKRKILRNALTNLQMAYVEVAQGGGSLPGSGKPPRHKTIREPWLSRAAECRPRQPKPRLRPRRHRKTPANPGEQKAVHEKLRQLGVRPRRTRLTIELRPSTGSDLGIVDLR